MSSRAGLAIITSSVVLFALVAIHAPTSVGAAPLSTNKCLDRGDSPVQCTIAASEVQVGWVWPSPEPSGIDGVVSSTTKTTVETTHGVVDADEGGDEVESLEARSFWGRIKHAVSHVTKVVTHPITTIAHAVAHPISTIKHVAHAVTHPISTIKHVVHSVKRTIRHVVHSVKSTIRTVGHTVKSAVHSVKSAYKFIKRNGPTIAKIGLKMFASSQGILSTVAKVIPGAGIPLSKALKMAAKGADMASGMIHANVPKGWGGVMSAMEFAEDPLGNTVKKAGLHGAVGAAASMASMFL